MNEKEANKAYQTARKERQEEERRENEEALKAWLRQHSRFLPVEIDIAVTAVCDPMFPAMADRPEGAMAALCICSAIQKATNSTGEES